MMELKHCTIRIDKFLADMGIGTSNEVKSYLKKGLVTVNQTPVKNPAQKVSHTAQLFILGTNSFTCFITSSIGAFV